MTKFYIATFLLSVGILGIGYSQSCTRSKAKDARTDLSKLTNEHTHNTAQHQQMRPTNSQQQLVGNPYLDENFVAGTVTFYNAADKPNRFAKMRFNAFTNTVEITAGGRFSYIQGAKIKQFALEQSGEKKTFINTAAYTGSPKPFFIEMLEPGQLQLARGLIVKVEKPAYGSQANGRPQNPKLTRTSRYYLIKDKKLYQVKRRKDLYKFFSKTDFKTKSFVKKYRTKIKTKDLKHLVKNYNEQVAKTNTRVITKTEQK